MNVWAKVQLENGQIEGMAFELVDAIPEKGTIFENEKVVRVKPIRVVKEPGVETRSSYGFFRLIQTLQGVYEPDDGSLCDRWLCQKKHPFKRLTFIKNMSNDCKVYYFDDDEKECLGFFNEKIQLEKLAEKPEDAIGFLKNIKEIDTWNHGQPDWMFEEYDEVIRNFELYDDHQTVAEIECQITPVRLKLT